MEQQIGVIIVAGGGGTRMGGSRPKQFTMLGGLPVLAHTINNFAGALPGAEIVVVLPAAHADFWKDFAARFDIAAHTVTTGGDERFHSVKNGLKALKRDPELIAVQDGVRPLASHGMIRRAVAAAAEHGTAIPVVEAVDSYRETDGTASRIADRRRLRIVQTPQVFRAELLRRAYDKARQENPALERLFAQEREQAVVQMNLSAKNYALAAEPMSNVYGALYSTLATDDPNQRKSMRYIGSCIGRIFYLLDKAERFEADRRNGQYNVFVVNELNGQAAAIENARRQALAAVNDLMRAYKMLDLKLNDTLLNNIMILGLQHAVYPLEQDADTEKWEIP